MKISRRGFSLVEMLVAIVLITLLIGIAIFSFRSQLITISKTQKVGINQVLTYNQLRSSLQSIKHYVVDDYDKLNYPMKNLHVYFNGTKNKIDYITKNPLFSDEIAVVKLECIDTNLIYKEEPLYGNIDFLRPNVRDDSRKSTLYKNLDVCEFKYTTKSIEYESVKNKIPDTIILKLHSEGNINEFYVNVKSDYNISVREVNNAIYPVD